MEEEHLLRSDSISLTPKSTKCFETSYTACWNVGTVAMPKMGLGSTCAGSMQKTNPGYVKKD
jgi:hypothetical protein